MPTISSSLIVAASRAKAKQDKGEVLDPVEQAALDEWMTFRQGMYKPKERGRSAVLGSNPPRLVADDQNRSGKVH